MLISQALMHIIMNRITVNRKTCISKGKQSYLYSDPHMPCIMTISKSLLSFI